MSKISSVGLFAPASSCHESIKEEFEKFIYFLEEKGLKIISAKNIFSPDDFNLGTAGNINDRLEEFHRLYFDKQVDALWAVRGGYGSMHLLPHLEYEKISKSPKAIMGYSDLTALFLSLIKHSQLQCFHGPVAYEFFKKIEGEPDEANKKLLAGSKLEVLKFLLSLNHPHETIQAKDLLKNFSSLNFLLDKSNALKEDKKILGGNLSILVSLLGTKFLPEFSNSILFLEEYNEPRYKADRMLHQLIYSGLIDKVSEIWIGKPELCDFSYEPIENFSREKNIKIIRNLDFGHGAENFVLPLG